MKTRSPNIILKPSTINLMKFLFGDFSQEENDLGYMWDFRIRCELLYTASITRSTLGPI